jgi:outer membrane protein assembly factor BamB
MRNASWVLILVLMMAFLPIGCSEKQAPVESTPIDATINTELGACFRADPEHSGSYQSSGIIPEGKVKWELPWGSDYTIGGSISEGIIVCGQYQKAKATAIDSETGELIWAYKMSGEVTTRPAIADGIACFGSNDGYVYAVDLYSGQELWRFKTKGEILSSPTIVAGVVYFGCDEGSVYALNVLSGDEIWRFENRKPIESSPAYSNGKVFFGCDDFNVYAVDATTGKEEWRFRTEGPVTASPAVSGGIVFIGSSDFYLYALDENSGDVIWKSYVDCLVVAPTLADGSIYTSQAQDSQMLIVSLDQKTSAENWRYQSGVLFMKPPFSVRGVSTLSA